MMQKKHVTLAEIYPESQTWPWAKQAFNGFCTDSRHIEQGQIFIALMGTVQSHHEQIAHYIHTAFQRGAVAVLTECPDVEQSYPNLALESFAEKIIYIKNLREILGELQQKFLQAQQPQTLATVVAVTGTNGKTTISRLIAELLTLLHQPTAVMGTTGNGILPNLTPSTHTTLQAIDLQKLIYKYSQQGAKFVALEASSHGLIQGRLAGTVIEVASFSNLSRDHLDYHGTLEQYAQAKALLFKFPSLKHAIIHHDDEFAELMRQTALDNPAKPSIWQYSIQDHGEDNSTTVDYRIRDITFSLNGTHFKLYTPTQQVFEVQSPLLGRFNVANIVQAMISVEKLGFSLEQIIPFVPQLKGASGRMQTMSDRHHQRLCIVDYAHTPDALQQVLTSLRHHVTGHLWVVFGCGGDRDRGKRPLMTQVAVDYADKIILTTDNPRFENVQQIMDDMVQGVDFKSHTPEMILDRREAIKFAIRHAQAGDIVVIAGKGHENYQEIEGVRHWFDDAVEVRSALDTLDCTVPPTFSA